MFLIYSFKLLTLSILKLDLNYFLTGIKVNPMLPEGHFQQNQLKLCFT